MIGLGDPERIVIDCAGDQWYVRGPGGAVHTMPAPGDAAEFVAPTLAARLWSEWLSDAAAAVAPARDWTVLTPSVFGSPRRSLVAAGAAALGVNAQVIPRAEAIADTSGLLYCRRALVVECRTPVAQAHVLDLVGDHWQPVAAASHPDPAVAARSILDDRVDQALIDAGPDDYQAVRAALARAGLWRAVRTEPGEVLAALTASAPDQPARTQTEVTAPPRHASPRVRRWPIAAAGSAVLTTVAAGAVACLPGEAPAPQRPGPPPDTYRRVAFDGALVELPEGWSVTEPAPGRRMAQAADGRRVTVVRARLRSPSDTSGVAAELKAALARRTDHRIADLNPSVVVAGREVIGYRELLDAQRSVNWYVVVAGEAQLSVGCEAGDGAAPLTAPCERAVGTVREE
ncbi:hypothetical protein GCM10027289_11250 [Tsukamurella serpentis]